MQIIVLTPCIHKLFPQFIFYVCIYFILVQIKCFACYLLVYCCFSFQHLWKSVSVYILQLYLFSTLQLFWSVCASPYTRLVTATLFCLSTLSTSLVSKTENIVLSAFFHWTVFFVFFCFLFFKSLFLTDTAAPDAASLTICSHIFWCPPFFLFF